MNIHKPVTIEEVLNAMNPLKPKNEIHVNNEQMYSTVIDKLGYEPNLIVHHHIRANEIVIFDNK